MCYNEVYPEMGKEVTMKKIKSFLWKIAEPFISVAVMIDESKRINEDGSWDKYWSRKNKKKRRK
jgi:hypothetical protein